MCTVHPLDKETIVPLDKHTLSIETDSISHDNQSINIRIQSEQKCHLPSTSLKYNRRSYPMQSTLTIHMIEYAQHQYTNCNILKWLLLVVPDNLWYMYSTPAQQRSTKCNCLPSVWVWSTECMVLNHRAWNRWQQPNGLLNQLKLSSILPTVGGATRYFGILFLKCALPNLLHLGVNFALISKLPKKDILTVWCVFSS